jgi:predicted ArsR family transcriptional regulator
MHATKSEILAQLKRNHGATVDELASALDLAPMTVRQHLTTLERDDLVRAEEVRRPTGRPHYLYRLTVDGHRHVADGYDRLLALIVAQAGSANGASNGHAVVDHGPALFHAAAEALADRHHDEVRRLSVKERMDRATTILRNHGGFAEWRETDDGFEILDYGCVYRSTVGGDGPCPWHVPFLERLLDASVLSGEAALECNACCRYVVPSTSDALTRGPS